MHKAIEDYINPAALQVAASAVVSTESSHTETGDSPSAWVGAGSGGFLHWRPAIFRSPMLYGKGSPWGLSRSGQQRP